VTKQWTEKWPYIAKVVFWIVKIIVNEVVFAASTLDPPRYLPESLRELITKVVSPKIKLGYICSQKKI